MKRLTISLLMAATMAATFVATEPDARACGGCFVPPENNTIVTDHRMILSVGRNQTTLYDQIRYTGDPKEFAWVLPISGTATVGLSADTLFGALDNLTQVQVQAPTPNCPRPTNCRNAGAAASDSAGSSSGSGGVTVLKQEVVGPYETVQLRSTDADALKRWLAANNFAIPADINPVIDQYVAEKFDFLAMKLVPGATVKSMRPVRVTTQGAGAALPLRMVAAGTGPTVGITLWVLGEGRYEPQNFQSFIIKAEDLVWDWTAGKSNYKELRAARSNGSTWEVETSVNVNLSTIESYLGFSGGGSTSGAPGDDGGYLPETSNGVITKSASQVKQEDMNTLFSGIASGRVTRIRADLARAALGKDLLVTASADQSLLQGTRQVTKTTGTFQCPQFPGCDTENPDGTPGSGDSFGGSRESFSCTTAPSNGGSQSTNPGWLAAVGAALGLAAVKASRRRKSA